MLSDNLTKRQYSKKKSICQDKIDQSRKKSGIKKHLRNLSPEVRDIILDQRITETVTDGVYRDILLA